MQTRVWTANRPFIIELPNNEPIAQQEISWGRTADVLLLVITCREVMKKQSGTIIYSPSDLIRYLASPFASWLDRYYLENPDAITPDEQTDKEKVLSHAGDEHEQAVLNGYKASGCHLVQ